MHSKSRLIPFVLILLTLLASCAYQNTGSLSVTPEADRSLFTSDNSRTVMPGTGKYTAPSYYLVKLISSNTNSTVVAQDYYPPATSVTFEGVPFGTYKVEAYGYAEKGSEVPLGYGEGTGTVSAGGTTGTTITVTPVSLGDYTGTVKIDMSWASNVQIDKIVLVDSSNNQIATQTVTDASTATSTTFEQPVAVGLDKMYHFNFYFGDKYVGSTGEEVFNIYAGQIATTDNPDIYKGLTFEEAITLRGFAVSTVNELGKVKISYTVPDAFASIVFTSTIDGTTATVKTIEAGDASLPEAGETASFIVEGLEDGTEYTFSAYIKYSDVSQSETITETVTTPLQLTTVKLIYDETEANNMTPNGTTMTLTAEYTPSTAADFGGTWESSNPTVATVTADPTNSKIATITGVGMGETTITYTAVNNNVKAEYTLNISLNKPSLTVTPTAEGNVISWISNGVADTYEILRSDQTDPIYTIKEKSTLTYIDTKIVSGQEYSYAVRASLNGQNPATSEYKTVTAISDPDITINFVTPERLEVEMADLKQNQEFERDETVTLSANIDRAESYQWYLNGKTRDDWNTNTVTFNSTDTEVEKGYTAARQSVMLKIKADNGLTYSGTLYFYFVDRKATGIEFAETSKKVYTTDTEAYVKANIIPANASLQKVKYTSDDPSVVTVDPDTGKVTALKNGEATITASTLDGSYTSTMTIDAVVTSLTLNQEAGILIFTADREDSYHKETTTLSYSITEGVNNSGVTWANNNESVVSITDNEDGSKTVTPLTAGTAAITVASVDYPSLTATYNVTVYEAAIFHNEENVTVRSIQLDDTLTVKSTQFTVKFRNNSDAEFTTELPNSEYSIYWPEQNLGPGIGNYTKNEETTGNTVRIKKYGTSKNVTGYHNGYIRLNTETILNLRLYVDAKNGDYHAQYD